MRLKTEQRIDRTVGKWICSAITLFNKLISHKRPETRSLTNTIRTILVIKFWGIGSIILASSGVRQIKRHHPDADVIFLTLRRNQEIIEALSICDEAIFLEIDCGIIQLIRNIVNLLYRLKKRNIDVVIDLEYFTCFSAFVSYFASAPTSGGFYDRLVWRGALHTIEVPFNHHWHTKKNFENLISRCIYAPIEDYPVVRPTAMSTDRQALLKQLAQNGIDGCDKIICLNVNAGELAIERRWPTGHFVKLVNQLAQLYPSYKFVFIGAKSENEYVSTIFDTIHATNTFNLSGELSIGTLIVLLEHAELLITNDSGPLHLAVALDIPTVSFFGPESPILYGPPRDGKHIVLYKDLDCSPCINVYNGKCIRCVRKRRDCLWNITPDEAMHAIKRMQILIAT